MKIENVSQTISTWLKDKLVYTSIGHNYAIFTYKGEYGWEDHISMVDLKNMVEYNESIIIYDKEANSFTKYDWDGSDDDYPLTLEDFDLCVRPFNCLKKAGIHTRGQLKSLSINEILNIRNMGRKSAAMVLIAVANMLK